MKTSKDVFNIVCGDISVKIDFRYEDKEEFKEFIEKVYIIFASNVSTNNKNKKAFYSFDLKDHCPPLEKARDYEEKLMPYILSVQNQENRRLNFNESGGAADINYLAHKDIFSVDGFGPVGGKLHCMDEYVWLPSLETRSNAFCNYLKYKARHETTIENRRGYGSPFSELRR